MMLKAPNQILRVCTLLAFATCAATLANAQCSRTTTGIDGIGTEKGKPFSAEKVNSGWTLAADGTKTVRSLVEYVARDSEGRVRIERLLRPSSPTAPQGEIGSIPRVIMICDPAAGSLIQLNPMQKTAEITEDPSSEPTNLARHAYSTPFFPTAAAKMPPDSRFEDLGYKNIEGVETHGGRFTTAVRVDERWSSDDLAADVLVVYTDPKTGIETRIALIHITRAEPDPSLFAIPEGFSATRTILKSGTH